ncbi:hypothetical protein GCM10027321_14230 [Massilia terrae]|uniref:DUF2946 domain-containing protein n=1 Tax=Massilia terrae TaxID=1811224 RepID=A0ABT2CUT2_9BURK|nr:hypothetical protein [Massilia terrae]MCS0657732.1 hypothetical protein [Massilia terrae]
MKSFLRILIVWLVLLAVPFAGFAQAATSCCPPGGAHAMQQTRAEMHHHDGAGHHACAGHHGTQDHTSKHDAKCANCAACCTGAMLAPLAFAPPAVTPPPSTHAIAFDIGHVPTVDLDHPERPPRFARA